MSLFKPYFFYRFWHITILENLSDWKWSLKRDWKSLKYSIRHGRLYKICPECCGEGTYYNSYDMRDCGTCGTTGFSPVRGWDVDRFFYSQQRYYFKNWLKRVIFNCSKRKESVWHEHCRYGTCGCQNHPLVNDWEGKPLLTSPKK